MEQVATIVPLGRIELSADISLPDHARGLVLPTLFIVGGDDAVVLDLNYSAMAQLPRHTEHKLEVVPGASHLFEEPGTLDQVAALARDWFSGHLGSSSLRL